MSRPLTPAELWEELVQEAGEEEIAEAAAMTDAEVDADLVAGGFDLAEVEAQAQAALARIGMRSEALAVLAPKEKAAPERSGLRELGERRKRRMPRTTLWLAAAATIAAGGALAYATLGSWRDRDVGPDDRHVPDHAPRVVPSSVPTEAPAIADARELREKAAQALIGGDVGGALRMLNQAAEEDPEGDKAAKVKELRMRIDGTMGDGKKGTR